MCTFALLCPVYLHVFALFPHLLLCLLLLHMRASHPCMMHTIQVVLVASCLCRGPPATAWGNSWSDTGRVTGPTGRRCTKGGVSGPAEDLRPVSEVEAGVNFRPAGGVRGQVCRFTSQEATRHRNQACQGGCGHTFPPPGGSWYPIRVTWMRIGHQAIDGLDEGV